MLTQNIYNRLKLLNKVNYLSSEEISNDVDWDVICSSPFLVHELLKTGKFHHLGELPSDLFNDPIIASLLMNYEKPPIQFIPLSLFSNPYFIYCVLENSYSHIQYIPKQFINEDLLVWYCEKFGEKSKILSFLPTDKLTTELVKILVSKNGLHFNQLDKKFQNDIDIYMACHKKYHLDIFNNSGSTIKSNPYIVVQLLEDSPQLYSSIDESLKTSDFFLRQLKDIPNLLEYATKDIQDNEHCVWESVKINPTMLCYASQRLLNTPSFCLQVSKEMNKSQLEKSFEAWGEHVTSHKETILELIPQLSEAGVLNLISDELRSDAEIMLQAIKLDSFWFKSLHEPLKSDCSFFSQCYDIILKQDQYVSNKYKRANSLFSYINEDCFNDPKYLLYLYEHFSSIFLPIIYPVICHHETPLIIEMKEAHETGEENVTSFMEKIKLMYSLEKQLHINKSSHDIQKI